MRPVVISILIFNAVSVIAQPALRWQYITSWGEKGINSGQFLEPCGLDVDPRGYLYIADAGNHRIQTLNSRGEFVTEIGGFGWQSEQFDQPVALSAGNGLDVLVADHNNDRIQRYDKDLHYLASYQSSEEDAEQLQFGLPLDLDLSPQGELFCLDGFNRRILKFDTQGRPQRSFGDFDSGEGRLDSPRRMMIHNTGHVFVSDLNPPRIMVFDVHGNFLRTFGEGILQKPYDFSAGRQNSITVADAGLKDVLWFDIHTGALQARLSEIRLGLVKFIEPVDAAIWKERLYVLDRGANQIHVFELLISHN